ncbi:MAG: cobalamin-independent methionine synthase II family protein, partial [Deltaproteobacteria bacterium]|nr:cobalamin-independent methionine synthase II family protein [Deltaproteobacteria bacterium]
PAYLKQHRKAWEAGQLPTSEFKRSEDRAVDSAIALQEEIGLDVVTDGEMRRALFTGTLTEAIEGISPTPGQSWHWFGPTPADEMDYQPPVSITGRIRRRRSLATEEFAYARGQAHKPLKITLPSPMMLFFAWSPEHSKAAYKDPFELFADAADILRQEVQELSALGCQYIQIDAPEIATLVDDFQRRTAFEARGISPERMLNEGVEMLNALADAPGVTFGLHMCKGNNAGHWMSKGGYEAISKQVFRRATKYHIILLEYDDARSGSFEALRDIPRDKTVVLGLISTKTNTLESAEGLISRIEEASKYFPREQLALSPQCGFASIITGNPITEAVQQTKLRLVADVAHRIWR